MSSSDAKWIGRKPNSDDPEFLYKYCQFDRHKIDLLEKGELYFPSPSQLNDPFDCKVSPNYSDASDQEMLNYIQVLQHDKLKKLSTFQAAIEKRELLAKFRNDWGNTVFRQNHFDKYFSGIESNVGILSFSKKEKSNALWGHYGNSHKGMLTKFDFKKLFESIHLKFKENNSPTGLFYTEANYSGYPKDVTPLQKRGLEYLGNYYKKLYSYKSPVWSFEDEYRIITFPTKTRKIIISSEAISEVVAGVNMESPQFEKLKSISHNRFTLKKSRIKEESFDLEYYTI